jgi:sec-independent protein translocase protein TatA
MPELIIVLILALLIFGPKKLPDLGRSLGRTITEFKRATNELHSRLDDDIRTDAARVERGANAKA